MCLAIPGKLIEVDTHPGSIRMGKANFGGIVKQVCLEYTPEAKVDDYVLVHVGFALSTIDEAEATRTYELLKEMSQLQELEAPETSDDSFSGSRAPSPQSSHRSAQSRSRPRREAPGQGRNGVIEAPASTSS